MAKWIEVMIIGEVIRNPYGIPSLSYRHNECKQSAIKKYPAERSRCIDTSRPAFAGRRPELLLLRRSGGVKIVKIFQKNIWVKMELEAI